MTAMGYHVCPAMPEGASVEWSEVIAPYVGFGDADDHPFGSWTTLDVVYCPWCGRDLMGDWRRFRDGGDAPCE